MFKLIKFTVVVAFVAGGAYFAFVVSLGGKTLCEHLVGISETQEVKTLTNELEKKAEDAKNRVSNELRNGLSKFATEKAPSTTEAMGNPVSDEIELAEHSEKDRTALDRLLKKKIQKDNGEHKALK